MNFKFHLVNLRCPAFHLKRFSSVFVISLFLPMMLHAAEFQLRDDSVVFGRILRLVDGKDLVVDTAHLGEVTLEWDALDHIHGTDTVAIEFFDGRIVHGIIELDGGILSISGDKTLSVDPGTVFSISEVKYGFWDTVDAYIDIGLNIVRGNSRVTQLRLGAGAHYDSAEREISIDATTFSNQQSQDQDTRRTTLSSSYTKLLDHGWSAIGFYMFESNEEQDLDSRSVLGGAGGKRIINNRAQRVELFAGLALNSENFANSSYQDTSEALLGARYWLRSGADIDATLIHFQNTEQNDRYRVQFDATLAVELGGDFDLNITVYDRYDSDPPEGITTNDYGLVLGLRWSR